MEAAAAAAQKKQSNVSDWRFRKAPLPLHLCFLAKLAAAKRRNYRLRWNYPLMEAPHSSAQFYSFTLHRGVERRKSVSKETFKQRSEFIGS